MIDFNRDQELTSKEAIWCCIGDKGKHENFVMFLVVAVCYCVTGSYGVLLVVTTCYWLLLFGTVCYGLLPVVTVCSWFVAVAFFFVIVFVYCVTAFFWLLHITHNVSL